MSRSRKPRLIYDPNDPANRRDLDAMTKRLSRLLIAGGATAVLVGAALGMMVNVGFIGVGLLGGLAFALGVNGLAERKQYALPVFVIGLGAPFVLTFGGHSVLLDRIGHVEHCAVESAQEHRSKKRPVVEYVLSCPSGTVELTEDWSDRLSTAEADVRVGPPLRPLFARPDLWNLPLVLGVPVVMIAVVPIARALRKQP